MKTLIFDIQMGSSGDMLLGSLLDLGLDAHRLVSSLKGLGLPGWEINPSRVVKHHLQGTLAGVTARDEAHERHLGESDARSSSTLDSVREMDATPTSLNLPFPASTMV